MRRQARDRADREVESLLSGHGEEAALNDALQDLRTFAAIAPPAPSAALAALFDSAAPVPVAIPVVRSSRRRWQGGVLVAVTGLTLGTAGAAAANVLPDDAQRAAATVLNNVTPFHFPTPAPPRPPEVEPVEHPSEEPSDEVSPPAAVVRTSPSEDPSEDPREDREDGRPTTAPAPSEHSSEGTDGTDDAPAAPRTRIGEQPERTTQEREAPTPEPSTEDSEPAASDSSSSADSAGSSRD